MVDRTGVLAFAEASALGFKEDMLGKAETLKEWRELRGMSREELAEVLSDRAGVEVEKEDIARWEEVGFPVRDGSEGVIFGKRVADPLMEILAGDAHESLTTKPRPITPEPGQWVINPAKLAEINPSVIDLLRDQAEEIDLEVAVPNRYDVALVPWSELEEADHRAVAAWLLKEEQFNRKMLEGLQRLGEFVEAQERHEGEDITAREAYRRHEEGTQQMQKLAGEEEPEATE